MPRSSVCTSAVQASVTRTWWQFGCFGLAFRVMTVPSSRTMAHTRGRRCAEWNSRPGGVSAVLARQPLARSFRGAGQDAAGGREAGSVARTVTGMLHVVPAHFASQVRADRREQRRLAVLTAVRGRALPLHFDDLLLAAAHRAQRARLGAGEAIADQVVGIVDVLLEI